MRTPKPRTQGGARVWEGFGLIIQKQSWNPGTPQAPPPPPNQPMTNPAVHQECRACLASGDLDWEAELFHPRKHPKTPEMPVSLPLQCKVPSRMPVVLGHPRCEQLENSLTQSQKDPTECEREVSVPSQKNLLTYVLQPRKKYAPARSCQRGVVLPTWPGTWAERFPCVGKAA